MTDGSTRLAKRLAELERSTAWLARKVGVGRSTAWRWAAGEARIPDDRLADVAAAVGLEVAELSHD